MISDYRLEGGATGIEALRSIEAQVGAPILSVVLTGDTAPERIAEVQASGYCILHKPIRTQELRALLDEVSGLAAGHLVNPPMDVTSLPDAKGLSVCIS